MMLQLLAQYHSLPFKTVRQRTLLQIKQPRTTEEKRTPPNQNNKKMVDEFFA